MEGFDTMNDAPEKIWVHYEKETDDAVWSEYPYTDGLDGFTHYGEYTRSDLAQHLTVLPNEQFDNFLAAWEDTSTNFNLSGWIERRKRDVGPYADHIISSVSAYEVEIERLRLELFWISLGPGYTETPSDAVLEMMRVASEALKETP
jgi:hypothetical protein